MTDTTEASEDATGVSEDATEASEAHTEAAEGGDDASLTTEEQKRWEWLSTVLAALTGLSLPIFLYWHAVGYIELTSVGTYWFLLYAGGYIAAIKFSLGRGEFTALREFIKG